jgi:alanine racemase
VSAASPARSPHRAWIEIDHAALVANLARVRELAGGTKQVIAVVKADAYGHGAGAVAATLVSAGVERLAVATLGEAEALRGAGIEAPLVILWGIGAPEAEAVVRGGFEATVYDALAVELIERAAAAAGVRAGLHLKVDTGLGRQGTDPGDAVALAGRIARSRHLRLVGTFSHLAVPGEDDAYTDVQVLRLAQALDAMRSGGVNPGIVHVSATGAMLAGAGEFADAVRPGIGLYGLVPAWASDREHGLRPVLSLRALPLRIFELPAGAAIGYGLRFRAERATRIATLGIGYGDGWPRVHTNNGHVLVRGHRARIVGAVSMDGITVDVGEVDDVTYGDEFVLIGEQMGARITAEDVASERRTINYEVTTALRNRLPRIHLGA